jgi:hypothetical protein
MESFTNVHIAADMHAHSRFSNPHYLDNHECREPPKKYTTAEFSQRLSRRGWVAQIE